jgi:carbonic anhydrase/acetyltransferase-like protein (isoleucine patch superfamily)
MEKKHRVRNHRYRYTGKTRVLKTGELVHQIIDKSTKLVGGWIQGQYNLDPNSDAWVDTEAVVYGRGFATGNSRVLMRAQVFGHAIITDNALVSDRAQLYDDALVCGDSKTFDFAQVFGHAIVSGAARVFGLAKIYERARVCGDSHVWGMAHVCGHAQILYASSVYGDSEFWIDGKTWVENRCATNPIDLKTASGRDFFAALRQLKHDTRDTTNKYYTPKDKK